MKKLLHLSALALATLNLGGCVIYHSQMDIAADGSGTMEITVAFSPSVAEAITELQSMDTGNKQDVSSPIIGDIDRDALEEAGQEYGVEVTKFAKDTVNGQDSLNIVLAFKDLKGFSYIMEKIAGDVGSGGGMGLYDAEGGNYVLKNAQYRFPVEAKDDTVAENGLEQVQKQMAIMGQFMAALSELDISIKITVPGDIISTNAPEIEARTSIWRFNSQNMPSTDQSMDPKIVFSGKGLKITPLEN